MNTRIDSATARAARFADNKAEKPSLQIDNDENNSFLSFLGIAKSSDKPNKNNTLSAISENNDAEDNIIIDKPAEGNDIDVLKQIIGMMVGNINIAQEEGGEGKTTRETPSDELKKEAGITAKSKKNIKVLDNNINQLATDMQKIDSEGNAKTAENSIVEKLLNINGKMADAKNPAKEISQKQDGTTRQNANAKTGEILISEDIKAKNSTINISSTNKSKQEPISNELKAQLNNLGQYDNSSIKINVNDNGNDSNQIKMEKNILTSSQNSPEFMSNNMSSEGEEKANLKYKEMLAEERNMTQLLEKSDKNAKSVNSDIKQTKQGNDIKIFTQIRPGQMASKLEDMAKNIRPGQKQSARLMLKPEYLGTVFVELSISARGAKLNIKAENRQAQKEIENQISSLKEKFSEIGLKTESINIELSGDDNIAGSRSNNSYQMRERRSLLQEFISSFKHLSAGSNAGSSIQDEQAAKEMNI